MDQVLHVVSVDRATTEVPYCPDMLLCDYLRRVLAPRVALHIAHNGESVLDTFRIDRVVLNRENRLLRLGDLVAAGGRIDHIARADSSEAVMRGNAARGDVTDPCSICLDEDTDLELPGCHHRFHSPCLGLHLQRAAATCPLCRCLI